MEDKHLVFTMKALEDVMDYVHYTYIQPDDVPYLPPKYQAEIDRDPMLRFFAYDVATNNMLEKVDGGSRRSMLNNMDGARNALYPDVVKFIDEHEDIRLVTTTELVYTELEGSLGVITKNVTSVVEALNDVDMDLLDIEFLSLIDTPIKILKEIARGSYIKGIKHLHLQYLRIYGGVEEMAEGEIDIAIELPLTHLSVNNYQYLHTYFYPTVTDTLMYLRHRWITYPGVVTTVPGMLHNLRYLQYERTYNYIPDEYMSNVANLLHLSVSTATDDEIARSPNLVSLEYANRNIDRPILPENLLVLDVEVIHSPVQVYPIEESLDDARYLRVLDIDARRTLNLSDTNLVNTCTILSITDGFNYIRTDLFELMNLEDFNALKVLMFSYQDNILTDFSGVHDDVLVGISSVLTLDPDIIRAISATNVYFTINPSYGSMEDFTELLTLLRDPAIIQVPQAFKSISNHLTYLSDAEAFEQD